MNNLMKNLWGNNSSQEQGQGAEIRADKAATVDEKVETSLVQAKERRSRDNLVQVRVILSDDTVIRMACAGNMQMFAIAKYLQEARKCTQAVTLQLMNPNGLAREWSQDDRIDACLQDGDILLADVGSPCRKLHVVVLSSNDLDAVVPQDLKLQEYGTGNLFPEENISLVVPTDEDDRSNCSSSSSSSLSSSKKSRSRSRSRSGSDSSKSSMEDEELEEREALDGENNQDGWRKSYLNEALDVVNQEENSGKDLLVQASLQLAENTSYYHKELRTIYHAVRNFKEKGTCDVHQLLPRLHRLVAQDKMPLYLSAGITTILSGWLELYTTGAMKWSPLKRKSWGVLWDCKISLFKNEEYSRKYILALSKERRGTWSSIGARMIEEYSPQNEFSISGWTASTNGEKPGAFVLCDTDGKQQQVLIADTPLMAKVWAQKVNQESQHALVKRKTFFAQGSSLQCISSLHDPIRVPIQWLHLTIDHEDEKAKRRRVKCASLSQALKDIRRDSLTINGKLFAGSCIEDILSELAVQIVKHAENDSSFHEMDALQFARRVLIYSGRTQGGGDVLDAVQLFLKNPNMCICPDAGVIDPVAINVYRVHDQPTVDIVMKTYFKLIKIDLGEDVPNSEDAILGRVVGTWNQQVICQLSSIPTSNGFIEIKYHKPEVYPFSPSK